MESLLPPSARIAIIGESSIESKEIKSPTDRNLIAVKPTSIFLKFPFVFDSGFGS